MKSIKITLPVIIEANDYHEFPYAQDYLRKVIPSLKVKEVGFGYRYYAVAYIGRLTDSPVAKLIKETRIRCRKEQDWSNG